MQAMQWRPYCACSREDVGWQAIGSTDLRHVQEPTRLSTKAQPSMQLRCCALGGAVHCANRVCASPAALTTLPFAGASGMGSSSVLFSSLNVSNHRPAGAAPGRQAELAATSCAGGLAVHVAQQPGVAGLEAQWLSASSSALYHCADCRVRPLLTRVDRLHAQERAGEVSRQGCRLRFWWRAAWVRELLVDIPLLQGSCPAVCYNDRSAAAGRTVHTSEQASWPSASRTSHSRTARRAHKACTADGTHICLQPEARDLPLVCFVSATIGVTSQGQRSRWGRKRRMLSEGQKAGCRVGKLVGSRTSSCTRGCTGCTPVLACMHPC